MAPDPRRNVGGTVWAKADLVSREAKRVYGAASQTMWLRGTTIECTTRRNEGSKRAVTYMSNVYGRQFRKGDYHSTSEFEI